MANQALLVTVATVLSLTLAGCWNSGHHPAATAESSDIVGVWTAPAAAWDEQMVTFSEDGTFRAAAVSGDSFCGIFGSGEKSGAVDGGGEWTLVDGTRHPDLPNSQLSVHFSTDDPARGTGCTSQLFVEELGGELYLFTWIGDPDNDETVTFTKDASR